MPNWCPLPINRSSAVLQDPVQWLPSFEAVSDGPSGDFNSSNDLSYGLAPPSFSMWLSMWPPFLFFNLSLSLSFLDFSLGYRASPAPPYRSCSCISVFEKITGISYWSSVNEPRQGKTTFVLLVSLPCQVSFLLCFYLFKVFKKLTWLWKWFCLISDSKENSQ